MPKITGNKGEWSEIYVFLRLLEIGKLYAADENLNRIDNVFFSIINILRNENIGELEFQINRDTDEIIVFNRAMHKELLRLPQSCFNDAAEKVLTVITDTTETTFGNDEVEAFLDKLCISVLKAKNSDKADIRMTVHDLHTGFEAIQGFSIKSRLGSPSTLINAGRTTNFIYKVTGSINDSVMESFNRMEYFKDKFDFLFNRSDCSVNYETMESSVFKNNLLLIDGDLPEIVADALLLHFAFSINNLDNIVQCIKKKNKRHYDLTSGQPFYQYKIKKLLTESALGMVPATPWNGKADATGGYIVVKENGEVLCYHLFNRNDFENYLLHNTKLDTPSTGRHQYGFIYKENGNYYIKLNLQVRFIK